MTNLVESLIDSNGSIDTQRHCFVCDVAVLGKYYSLATCRTNNTRVRLIEKLGQMVGDKYMVVISEEDIICTACANFINNLDRLENEIISIRGIILRFLEKKYSLDEGELLPNKHIGFASYPQNGSGKYSTKGRPNNESFMSRKRKAALTSNMDFENDQENTQDLANRNDKKSNTDVWMQCDKCKYTTPYNAFLNNHINNISKKTDHCEFCNEELKEGTCPKKCIKTPKLDSVNMLLENNENHVQNLAAEKTKNDTTQNVPQEETVELITAEINEYNNQRALSVSDNLVLSTLQENVNPSNQTDSFVLPDLTSNQSLLMDSQQVSEVDPLNHNMIPNNDVKSLCQSVQDPSHNSNHPLLTIPKLTDENPVYVQVVDMGKQNSENMSSMTKQVLTVSEDGSVEMVEVVWDELLMSGQGSLTY